MKKFIFTLFLFFIPLVLLIPCWIHIVNTSRWNNFGILNYQYQKLNQKKGNHYRVIYIGDSSGGNAITTEDDSTSLNLCLSGSYGYEGLIPFIDIINNYITYDTIVVINSIDIATREVSNIAPWMVNIHSNNVAKKIYSLIKSIQFSKQLIKNYEKDNSVFKNPPLDYPSVNKKTKKKLNVYFNKNINKSKLLKLVALDKKLQQLNKPYCIFFGPSLPFDSIYFADLKASILKFKIHHSLNNPYLLTEQSKGNSVDHVSPEFKKSSTAFYKNLLNLKVNYHQR